MRSTVYDHRCRQRRTERAAFAFITSTSDISISFVSSLRPRSVAIVYFSHFPLSHLTLWKCQMYKYFKSKKVRLRNQWLHFESKNLFTKIHKISINNKRVLSLLKRFNVYKWLKISCLSMFLSYLLAEIILAFILLIANWFLWDYPSIDK